jgi:hypothetical protein
MPAMRPSRSLQLVSAAVEAASSPEHKRFKGLLQKIEQERQRLRQWQEQLPLFAQTHAEQVQPLRAQLLAERREFVFALEQLMLRRKWARQDAQTLSQWLCELVEGLLELADEEDSELHTLYDRHAEVSLQEQERLQVLSMRQMFEEMSGLDLSDVPATNVEELLAAASARLNEQPSDARDARHAGSARQTRRAKPKQAEAEQASISQTVREVFRKLASALHPDRAAELPEAQRQERTAQMQRANAAYERGDLLALLELQLQIDQIDLAQAAQVAADKLRHFNQVLATQLKEIQAEVAEQQHAFCVSYGVRTPARIHPGRLDELLKDEARALRIALLRVAADRRLIQGDETSVRRFLKEWRTERREFEALQRQFQ